MENAPAPAQPARRSASAGKRQGGAVSMRLPSKRGQYVVRSGDSLWSIAAELAGPEASPATIAEVLDRLWQENKDRIASGKADLIMPGEVLTLKQL